MEAMDYQTIKLEQPAPGICLLTLNRPQALNALNSQLLGELEHALGGLARNRDARALLVTGAGDRAFVAGADIVEMSSLTAVEAQRFSEAGLRTFRAIEALDIPAIAVVNGFALGGGCELALACDWIVASEKAVFGQPEINLGIIPGFGGTQRLSRLVGRALALELILTGRQIKAEEAWRIGLVNQVAPAEELLAKALETARLLADKAPLAVRHAKQVVRRGLDLDLDNACALESDAFGLVFATEDWREGLEAFLQKRPARFFGK